MRLLSLVAFMGGEVQSGYAPHYSEGLMERLARSRDMASVPCMISSPVYRLGTWVYVYSPKTKALRYCRVTDTSHPKDRERHLKTKRVVELSYEVTTDLCGSTRQPVLDCPVIVIRLQE